MEVSCKKKRLVLITFKFAIDKGFTQTVED